MALPFDQLQKVVEALAEAINVGFKLFNKSGIFAIVELSDELMALGGVSKDVFLAQLKDLDPAERKQLEKVFKDKLVLSNKSLELGLEEGIDCLEQAAVLVYGAIESGSKFYNESKALYNKVVALLSPPPPPVIPSA